MMMMMMMGPTAAVCSNADDFRQVLCLSSFGSLCSGHADGDVGVNDDSHGSLSGFCHVSRMIERRSWKFIRRFYSGGRSFKTSVEECAECSRTER
jgi:hypothetical protein